MTDPVIIASWGAFEDGGEWFVTEKITGLFPTVYGPVKDHETAKRLIEDRDEMFRATLARLKTETLDCLDGLMA